jgi:hypothetical protein
MVESKINNFVEEEKNCAVDDGIKINIIPCQDME